MQKGLLIISIIFFGCAPDTESLRSQEVSDTSYGALNATGVLPKCGYKAGDANHDGEFNSDDIIQINQAALYERKLPATWAEGDFNHDGVFDSADMAAAMASGVYDTGKYCEPSFRVFSGVGSDSKIDNLDETHKTATTWYFFKHGPAGYDMTAPDLDRVRRTGETWDDSIMLTVDIEHYENDEFKKHMHNVLDTLRGANPDLSLGVYRYMPRRDYWNTVHHYRNMERLVAGTRPYKYDEIEAKFAALLQHNATFRKADAFSRTPLASKVDHIMPSCYTFYRDETRYPGAAIANDPALRDWEIFCASQIAEARKFNKPVYVYLWPIYHPGGTYKDANNPRAVEGHFFRRQLELVYKLADGAVIWEGGLSKIGTGGDWNAELQDFLAEKNL